MCFRDIKTFLGCLFRYSRYTNVIFHRHRKLRQGLEIFEFGSRDWVYFLRFNLVKFIFNCKKRETGFRNT